MSENRFALLIANYEFESPQLPRLSSPIGDVHELEGILKDPKIGQFNEVTTLINARANEVRLKILKFFSKKSPKDLMLLYFSGHGVLDNQHRLHLATYDTDPEWLRAASLPAQFLTQEMDECRSRRQVLILDCCHSGAFAEGTKNIIGSNVGTQLMFKGGGYGRVILTATDKTQFAWEGNQILGNVETSFFTHYLVEGISTGNANPTSKYITVDSIYNYIYRNVKSKQNPRKWVYDVEGEIILALNTMIKKPDLGENIKVLISHPNEKVRLLAVGELSELLEQGENVAQLALHHLRNIAAYDFSEPVRIKALGCVEAFNRRIYINKLPELIMEKIGKGDWSSVEELLSVLKKEKPSQAEIVYFEERLNQSKLSPSYFLDELKSNLKKLKSLIEQLGLLNEEEINSRIDSLQQFLGPIRISFLGQFKTGKSTLINALLGEDIMPVGAIPVTKKITKVKFGKTKKVMLYQQNELNLPHEISWETFIKDFTFKESDLDSDFSQYNEIDFIQIEAPNKYLSIGIELIDNPAINTIPNRHSEYIQELLSKSHLQVFVINSTTAFAETELQFLRYLFELIGFQNVYIVLNRFDHVPEDEKPRLIKYAIDRFAELTGMRDSDRIFFVSALDALLAKLSATDNNEALKASRFLALEQELDRFVNEKQLELCREGVTKTKMYIRKILDRITSITELLKTQTKDHIVSDDAIKIELQKVLEIRSQLMSMNQSINEGYENLIKL